MNITGKIHKIYDEQQVSASFTKREFVIEFADNPMYPQYIKFEFTQDKCALLNVFKNGDVVQVDFNLRGREWQDPSGQVKYFNTLQAWRIGKDSQQDVPAPQNLPDDNDIPF